MKITRNLFIILFCWSTLIVSYSKQPVKLSQWQEGYLEIHFINTGSGNCAFAILPDGTTLLIDAGEQDPTSPRVLSPRNTPRFPNYSKLAHDWQVDYIKNAFPNNKQPVLNYALVTHYHGDHYGSLYHGAPVSTSGNYFLTGITGVGENIPIQKLIDRGYDYPYDLKAKSTEHPEYFKSLINYWNFIDYQQSNNNLVHEAMVVGSNQQITLINAPAKYPQFEIRNINANGQVWDKTSSSGSVSGMPDTTEFRALGGAPNENSLSCGIVINYGKFNFYCGGDIQGAQPSFMNKPKWYDVESVVAPAVGEVDVTTTNHHANRDAMSAYYLSILKPRVIIQEVWSSDHPGHETLLRLTSKNIWPDERDIFATNMLDANRLVIGDLINQAYKSTQGHIVLRVMPGGGEYYIYTLNQHTTERELTGTYGPYLSK